MAEYTWQIVITAIQLLIMGLGGLFIYQLRNIERRFETIDQRFDNMESRFGRTFKEVWDDAEKRDDRINALDKKQAADYERFASVQRQIEGIDKKMDSFLDSINRLQDTITNPEFFSRCPNQFTHEPNLIQRRRK